MTDYFALLNFPRAPWLDPDAVQARFLELSAPLHPDHAHNLPPDQLREANRKFAELNSAAACLREPRARLNHLLQLESPTPTAPAQQIPPTLIDLFTRIGQTCRSVDQFLAERARATSPILQAQLFAQGLDWTDRLTELQTAVADLRQKAEADLKQINSAWPDQKPLDHLRQLAHTFATLQRWQTQLQERFASLAAFS